MSFLEAEGFINPQNNFIEVHASPPFLCLLCGPLWFLSKGIWGHFLLSLIAVVGSGGVGWVIYPFFARSILRNDRLSKGWILIE